jgi:hypothetical protein
MAKFFNTPRLISGRRFRRTWICWIILTRVYWRQGFRLLFVKIWLHYVLPSPRCGWPYLSCAWVTTPILPPPPRAGRRRWRCFHWIEPRPTTQTYPISPFQVYQCTNLEIFWPRLNMLEIVHAWPNHPVYCTVVRLQNLNSGRHTVISSFLIENNYSILGIIAV